MKKALITSTVEPIYVSFKGSVNQEKGGREGGREVVHVIKSKAWHEPADMTVTLSRKE